MSIDLKNNMITQRCRIALLVLLTAVLCAVFPMISKAETGHTRTVKVGVCLNPNFFEGTEDRRKTGYAYDYLQKVSYYADWEYEYIYGTWNEMIEKLYQGEIDLMPGVAKTPEREGTVLFPGYPMGVESYYIYAHADDAVVHRKGDRFNGHVIGVNRNSYPHELLEKWVPTSAPGATIRTFGDNESRVAAFYAGEINDTVATDISVNVAMDMVPVAWIGASDYYLAVSPGREDLLNELNAALGSITAVKPSFTIQLMEKYYRGNAVSLSLSELEAQFVSDHPVMRVGYYTEYMPFSGKDADGNVQGSIREIIQRIVKALAVGQQVDVEYQGYDSMDEMLAALKADEIDVMFPCENNPAAAEEEGIFLTSELLRVPMFMVFKGEYRDNAMKKIAVVSGDSFQKRFTETYYPDSEILLCDHLDDGFQMVQSGDADVILVNETIKDAYLGRFRNRKLKSLPLPENRTICMAVNRGNIMALSLLERGLTALPENFVILSTYDYFGHSSAFDLEEFLHDHIYAAILISILLAAGAITTVSYIVVSRKEKKAFERMAHTDNMTGLWNRRAYDEDLEMYAQKGLPADYVYIAADLNELKKYNDSIGHEAGDEMIITAAHGLRDVLQPYGKVYRIGGDEFAAMVCIPHEQQKAVLELLPHIGEDWVGTYGQRVTVSSGAVGGEEIRGMTIHEIQTEADRRMYEDKAAYYKATGHDRRK